MKIRRTKKIDKRGMIRLGRKFGVAPVFIAQLQQGKIVDLPDDKAMALVDHGYAIRAQHRQTDDITVDDSMTETPETLATPDYDDTDTDDNDDRDSNDSEDDEIQREDEHEGEKVESDIDWGDENEEADDDSREVKL